jgi:hypothetical protein
MSLQASEAETISEYTPRHERERERERERIPAKTVNAIITRLLKPTHYIK